MGLFKTHHGTMLCTLSVSSVLSRGIIMQDFRVIVPTIKSGWGVRQNPKLGKVGLLAKAKGMRVSD